MRKKSKNTITNIFLSSSACLGILNNVHNSNNIYKYESYHISKIKDITTQVVNHLADMSEVPEYTIALATRSRSLYYSLSSSPHPEINPNSKAWHIPTIYKTTFYQKENQKSECISY